MKLYMHPLSMTSRPVRLFIAEHRIQVEEQIVDLAAGEHMKPPFGEINPSRMVPVLEEGAFRLSESSAILKYLADKVRSPAYPQDLKRRAAVNDAMDWFQSEFYTDWAYGLCYPQLFGNHRRPSAGFQSATIEWACTRSREWFDVLNAKLQAKQFICGDEVTLADYLGVCCVTLGEVTRTDFAKYPEVARWIGTFKERHKSWNRVSTVINEFAEQVKDEPFVTI